MGTKPWRRYSQYTFRYETLPLLLVTNHPLFQDLSYFQSNSGVIAGSIGLAALWIILSFISMRGRHIGARLVQAIRLPLMLGLSSALYLGWLARLLASRGDRFDGSISLQVSASLTIMAIGWAFIRVGQVVFRSKRFENWLQIEDPKDEIMLIRLLERLFTILIIIITGAALMVTFGVSSTAVATLLGGAGIGLGFGTQQISQNFLSGFMLFFNRPFKEGDWISTNGMEGTVESIGWYHTRLRTFDRRPLYIPNAVFATNPIENPGQMYNRRIKVDIGLRYEDISKIDSISKAVRKLLKSHHAIDHNQTILVNFNQWDASSINLMVYCFTKTTVWSDWLDQQQEIFLLLADVVKSHGADFAFPSTSLYFAGDLAK